MRSTLLTSMAILTLWPFSPGNPARPSKPRSPYMDNRELHQMMTTARLDTAVTAVLWAVFCTEPRPTALATTAFSPPLLPNISRKERWLLSLSHRLWCPQTHSISGGSVTLAHQHLFQISPSSRKDQQSRAHLSAHGL